MEIMGIKIGRSSSGKRRRKRATTKLERMYNSELLEATLKYPRVLAVVIDKYGELPVLHEDELEPMIDNIRAKIHERAVQTISKHRRRELVTRIDEIIDVAMSASDRSGRGDRKRPVPGINSGGPSRTSATTYQQRIMGRGPKQDSSLLTFLEFLAFLTKLANQQVKDDKWSSKPTDGEGERKRVPGLRPETVFTAEEKENGTSTGYPSIPPGHRHRQDYGGTA